MNEKTRKQQKNQNDQVAKNNKKAPKLHINDTR